MQRKKEKLISKIVKKDFNNELETILEQKAYAENVKNALLSILYKIEAAYKDIKIVKQDIFTKEEYIKKLISAIQYECTSIKLIRINSKESKIPTNCSFFIDKQKKEIECYPIERKMLYAIWKIAKKDNIVNTSNPLLNMVFSDFLNVGNTIDLVEPLRDFNGYSWTTVLTEIESVSHNLIYQNLRILVGNKFLNNWIYNKETIIDYYGQFVEILNKRYGTRQANKIIDKLMTISVLLECKYNPEKLKPFKREKNKVEIELQNIEDKQKYIETCTKEKIKLAKQIREIDKILNNKDLLQKEYIKRNENLSLEKKIFSMRVLSDIMIREREEIYKKIEKLNYNLNPKNFVKHKKELEQKYKYLILLDTENVDEEIYNNLIKFQKIFITCFSIQIDKVETKQDIISLIYQMRYYLHLPVTREKYILEVIPEKNLKQILGILLIKAQELKAIQVISKDNEDMYKIWRQIFAIRAIQLEELSIKIAKDKQQQYYLQIFDEDIFEVKVPVDNFNNTKELKINKKCKIFE